MNTRSILTVTCLALATIANAETPPVPYTLGDTMTGVIQPDPSTCPFDQTLMRFDIRAEEPFLARLRLDTERVPTKTQADELIHSSLNPVRFEIGQKLPQTATLTTTQKGPAVESLTSDIPFYRATHAPMDNVIDMPSGDLYITLTTEGCEPAAYSFNLYQVPKLVSLGGIIRNPAGAPLPGEMVTVYTPDGAFVDGVTTDEDGAYAIDLAPGRYLLRAGASIYFPGKPFQGATEFSVTRKTTKNMVLGENPILTSASSMSSISSQIVSLHGSRFGAAKGYVDFGGYLSDSTTAIQGWTDNQITVKVPSSAIPGCWRVFSTQGGYSDCLMMSKS